MLVVAAVAGERSLSRGINEQRCSPFIYFPELATWGSLEPFLLLFRGSLRCSVPFGLLGFILRRSRRKESGGLTFTSAAAMVLVITSPAPTLSLPLEQKPAVQTVCFHESPSLPWLRVSVTPSLVRLAPALSEMEIKE